MFCKYVFVTILSLQSGFSRQVICQILPDRTEINCIFGGILSFKFV